MTEMNKRLFLLKAEVFVLDEVVQFTLQLHDFLDELCQQIRSERKYFGGLQVIFCGDGMQKGGGFTNDHEIAQLKAIGNNYYIELENFFFVSNRFLLEGKFKIVVLTNHSYSRYNEDKWFQFCSRARVGKLTQDDFEYFRSNIGYNISENDKSLLRSYSHKINRKVIETKDWDSKNHIYNSKMSYRLSNFSNISRERLDYSRSYEDKLDINDYLEYITLLNQTLFIVTENSQADIYIDFQKQLHQQQQLKSQSSHDLIYNVIAKDEIYAVDKTNQTSTLLEGDLHKHKTTKYKEIYNKYFNNRTIMNGEENISIQKGAIGNITTNSCGKYLAASQRFTIQSIDFSNSNNNEIESIHIEPHESSPNIYTNCIKINRITSEYIISNNDIPYEYKTKYKNHEFIVKRNQFPISMTNAKTVQYVMGLTLPDGYLFFDITRGVNKGEGYVTFTRQKGPSKIILSHEIKSLEELKQIIYPDETALKLDKYIMNQCKLKGNCVIDVDFIYEDRSKEFRLNSEKQKIVDDDYDKHFKKQFASNIKF
jgi:hypothetical protein